MKILTFTNYAEQAKDIPHDEFGKVHAPFNQADSSANMREYSKIWTIGSAVATVALTGLGYNSSPHLFCYPDISCLFWIGCSIQHQQHAVIAENLLAEYAKKATAEDA